MMAAKGHWPAGKRRHPVPQQWKRIVRDLHRVGRMRLTRELARRVGVHSDTIFRWRRGVDLPGPESARRLARQLARLYGVM